jgi:hypothetical protein
MADLLRTDLNAFLHAEIANDPNGMPLTLLSALARSGVDPWAAAADLARLPSASATQKLIDLLGEMPNGPPAGAQTVSLVARLMSLLHEPGKPASRPAPGPAPAGPIATRKIHKTIYYLFALIVLLAGNWALYHRHMQSPVDISTSAP